MRRRQHVSAQLSETDVAQFISDETTLNEGEALMAIRQLHKVLLRALLNGQSVKLGNWGYFGLSINSEGVEKKSDLTARNIKQVNANFRAGEELKAEEILLRQTVSQTTQSAKVAPFVLFL
ncbi:MAG: DNA-binding protein [Prevotellaceae bacterium]|nr:DNA-binding protein [Prevotellaceae bacterium]